MLLCHPGKHNKPINSINRMENLMKYKPFAFLFFSVALSISSVSLAAQIEQLQQQLNQLDQAIQSMPNGNPQQAQKYVNQLIAIANQLKTISNKDDAWKKAATDYNRLNQLAVTKARTAPDNLADQPADAATLKALDDLAKMSKRYEQMGPGDVNTANQMLAELKAMIPVINGAKNKYHPKWQELRKQYNQLNNNIVAKAKQPAPATATSSTASNQKVTPQSNQGMKDLPSYMVSRYKRIKRNVDGTTAQVNQLSNADLTNPKTVAKLNQRIQRQQQDVAKLEPQSNTAIINLNQQLKDTQELLAQKQKVSQASVANFGDVKTHVAQIDENMQKIKVPQALVAPVNETAIQTYVKQVKAVEEHVRNDLGYLLQIEGKTQLINKGTMSRLKHWIGVKPNELKQSLARSTETIDSWVERYTGRLNHLNQMDPNERKHLLQILQRDFLAKTLAELKEGQTAVKIAQTFDQASQRANPPNREQQLNDLQNTIAAMQQKFDIALKSNTMRKPQSTSPKLLKIARDTLAKPKYGVNPIERMIINYDLHSKQKKETVVEDKALVTYTYKWDEFQVTTAEKVGDQYYLFSNLFKYYYSANSVTPTDKWILSNRFEGTQILQENIQK